VLGIDSLLLDLSICRRQKVWAVPGSLSVLHCKSGYHFIKPCTEDIISFWMIRKLRCNLAVMKIEYHSPFKDVISLKGLQFGGYFVQRNSGTSYPFTAQIQFGRNICKSSQDFVILDPFHVVVHLIFVPFS
jgi:hypothetical protein